MRRGIAALGAIAVLTVSIVTVLAYGLAAPGATLLGPALVRLPATAGDRRIALTFDDGPSPYTPKVLDILRARGVKATFFLCGENARRYPELVRRIQAEGHVIGNHTYSHPYLHLMARARIAEEIDRTQSTLERITGRRPELFRPPYGVRWFTLRALLRERAMTMVMWTNDHTQLDRLSPGAIILLHDGVETLPPEKIDRSELLSQLPDLIARAKAEGYTFVTIPEPRETVALSR